MTELVLEISEGKVDYLIKDVETLVIHLEKYKIRFLLCTINSRWIEGITRQNKTLTDCMIPRIENYFLKLQKAQSIREKIGKLDQQQSKYSIYTNKNPKQQ